MEKENKEILLKGAEFFGIRLENSLIDKFEIYLKELIKWNQKINLTAIKSEKEIVIKHFIDSISVVPHLSQVSNLLDIGSGAGFPGIPIKIILPSIDITLIDSRLKKVDFQRHIIRKLGLKGIHTIHGRIEDKNIIAKFEVNFEVAISRAFSNLENLLRFASPYLKKGGLLIAMKGRFLKESLFEECKINDNIFYLKNDFHFTLPFSKFSRTILMFEKN